MKKKKKSISTIYFSIICVIAFIYILSPLIVQIPFVYDFIKWFLSSFKSEQYKNTYIGALGSIIGAFLAITGVIWTQKLFDNNINNKQNKENALIIYYDFKYALDEILEMVKIIYPKIKGNVFPEDEEIMSDFRKLKKKRRIYVNNNWRQLVTALHDELTIDEIQLAQMLFNQLTIISIILNSPISEISRKDAMNAYSIMCDMFNIEPSLAHPINYSITIKNNINSLQNKIADIAGIEQNKD